MSTDRLAVYNIACFEVGERSLGSLNENREPRYLLDEVWTRGQGAVRYFLEQGYWNWALRAVEIQKSTTVTPDFGLANAFELPSDAIRINMISADERFVFPLIDYEEEAGFIFADIDPLYLKYVSDDAVYGADFGKWPETFTHWAGTWMALQIAPRLKNDINEEKLEKREERLRIRARSRDASREPPRFPPLSSWNQARLGRGSGLYERGLRTKLIGS